MTRFDVSGWYGNFSWGIRNGNGSSRCFKNMHELLNLRRPLEISTSYKNPVFQCMCELFCVEFQMGPLKFLAILPIHWKMCILFICDNSLALQFKNLAAFSKCPPGPLFTKKTQSYGYRDHHDKPKTVWQPFQVYNGNPYTDKTASS